MIKPINLNILVIRKADGNRLTRNYLGSVVWFRYFEILKFCNQKNSSKNSSKEKSNPRWIHNSKMVGPSFTEHVSKLSLLRKYFLLSVSEKLLFPA